MFTIRCLTKHTGTLLVNRVLFRCSSGQFGQYNQSRSLFQKMHGSTEYVASIDQSTTSTKFSVFTTKGDLVEKQIIQHTQFSPQEGYLEHDPEEIIQNVNQGIQRVISRLNKSSNKFNLKEQLRGVGICNQRQTVVCWDKTGKPLYNAIVWCDARTKEICSKFKQLHGQFKNKTGLPVSTYFSLFKIIWLLQNVPQIRERMEKNDIRFGTIDSWLSYRLTGNFVTDASNASRTYLANLSGKWDQELLALYKIKQEYLPKIIGSFEEVGKFKQGPLQGIPVYSILGDQQSSAYAHGLEKDQMKITYGTGCFLLSNIGTKPEIHESFITTILSEHKGKIQYAYEAAVECGGGTLNWAKRVGLFNSYHELNSLTQPKGDLIFLPSFGSIFAPYWQDGAQGGFIGLNFNTTRQDLLYSLLESIAFRLQDNIGKKDFDKVEKILTDGGMTSNAQFMQLNADLFNKEIEVCELDTCWGVAKGVLTAQGIKHPLIEKFSKIYRPQKKNRQQLLQRYANWSSKRDNLYGWTEQK